MPAISQKLGFDARGASRSLTNITKKMKEATTELQRLKDVGGANILTSTQKSIETAKTKTEGLTVSWKTMARVVTTQIVVRSLNAFITQLEDAIESARKLGLAIGEIKSISGGSLGLDTSDLQADILKLSVTLGEDAAKVAEGVYQTLSNQVVDAADSMEFYEQAAKLAMVTNAESSDVVNALSSVMNSYKLNVEDTEEVMDTLAKTIELGRLRMSELGNSIGRVLPLASQMEIDYKEVAAALAVMTRQGVKLSTATTQLQAVLQKLLRPSEALQALYEKWGVSSGPQAIKVFGGLGGVLRKLQEETNFNVAEQGELFQRVRAVTSAMALGVDGGKEFSDTYEEIKDSAGFASDSVEEFRKTEAFKLTQAQQELKNSWTELGSNTIPLANKALQLLNNDLKAAAMLGDALAGSYNESYHALQRVNKEQEALNNKIKGQKEKVSPVEIDQLEQLSKDTAKYYAELNKSESRLRQIRTESIKAAGKALANSHEDVVKAYKDGIKGLEKFISDARNIWSKAAAEIAKVRSEADDETLDHRLNNANTASQKLSIIEDAIAKQRQKAAEAVRDVGASKESKEAAMAEQDRLRALLDSAQSIAEEAGNRGKLIQFQKDEIKAIESKEEIINRNRDATLNVAKAVEKVKESWEESAKTLDNLFKQREGLLDKLAGLDLTNNVDKQAANRVKTELQELDKQINQLFADNKYSAQFLKSLGVDTTFDKVSQGFQEALNKATFDWSREVDRAQAEFDKRVFHIKVEMDPAGRGEQTAKALGLPKQGVEEDTATFLQRTQRAGVETFKDYEKSIENVEEGMLRVSSLEKNIFDLTNGVLKSTNKIADRQTEAARTSGAGVLGKSASSFITQQQEAGALQQRYAESTTTALQKASEAIRSGTALTEQQTEILRNQVELYKQKVAMTANDKTNLDLALKLLNEQNLRQKAINEEEAKIPGRGKLEAIRAFIEQLKTQKSQQNENTQEANKGKQAIDGETQAIKQAVAPSNQVSQNLRNSSQGAFDTANGVGSATQVLPSTVGLADSLAISFSKAADEAERMARAAAAGGGATAYHGGPMNKWFASGGTLSRGNDRIMTALSAGETVINSKNSRRFFSELNAMNQGSTPVYREQGGPVTNVGDINVTVNGGDSSRQTIREIGHALRREIQRGNIKLS